MEVSFKDSVREILTKGDEPFHNIRGKGEEKRHLKSALILGRHIILVGPPGVGKTTLAKDVANILPKIEVSDCGFNCTEEGERCPLCSDPKRKQNKVLLSERFARIQGSPDLTVEDLIGDIDPIKALEYGPLSLEAFTPGKIFRANKGILFFDEVNRCPERLQNSLLQVLEEGKATIGNYTYEFPADFILIATMNPEDTSTEKLSDVFLDRFDMIEIGYPETLQIEQEIVLSRVQELGITFPPELLAFSVSYVQSLRENKDIEKKPSVRATIGLVERSMANALLDNRRRVELKDIKDSIVSVLSHRIRLKPSLKYIKSPESYVEETFATFTDKSPDITESKESDAP